MSKLRDMRIVQRKPIGGFERSIEVVVSRRVNEELNRSESPPIHLSAFLLTEMLIRFDIEKDDTPETREALTQLAVNIKILLGELPE